MKRPRPKNEFKASTLVALIFGLAVVGLFFWIVSIIADHLNGFQFGVALWSVFLVPLFCHFTWYTHKTKTTRKKWLIAKSRRVKSTSAELLPYLDAAISDGLQTFNGVSSLAWSDERGLIVCDQGAHCIYSIMGNSVHLLAGKPGESGSCDGIDDRVRFKDPECVVTAYDDVILVLDRGNRAVRLIASDGRVSTLWVSPIGNNCPPPKILRVSPDGKTAYILDVFVFAIPLTAGAQPIHLDLKRKFLRGFTTDQSFLLCADHTMILRHENSDPIKEDFHKFSLNGEYLTTMHSDFLLEKNLGASIKVERSKIGYYWCARTTESWITQIDCYKQSGEILESFVLSAANSKKLAKIQAFAILPNNQFAIAASNKIWMVKRKYEQPENPTEVKRAVAQPNGMQ